MESRCEDARMDFQAQEEEQTRDGAEDTMNIESLKCLPIASRKEEEKKSLDGWKLVDTNSAPSKPDFAALARAYGRPLIIKFYTAEIPECEQGELEVLAQIGNYTNVRPEEVVRCMNEQRALLGSLNLRIHIDIERPDLVALAKLALQNVLTRNNFALPLGKSIERVEFIMRDFVGCQSFAVLFKQKFNRLLELNIGGPTDQTKINHPAKEADSVLELLYEWMGGSCGRTLRCLRIFPFVKICPLLEGLVNNCPMLEHLTLSKLADYYQTLVFKDIKSFEFAGLGLSYSLIDLEFAKVIRINLE
ncbi:hypothetical protein WR25_08420 isoform F [Diploscapter pachys]|uniref:Uncharacterized protein n=1 Tax=Diploscapter pachys TaxID=2018661 RepID=A0A2A2KU25_9BILA|nr:hypothetical protein WR25_08420 isoform F [Diploscapter pachys]